MCRDRYQNHRLWSKQTGRQTWQEDQIILRNTSVHIAQNGNQQYLHAVCRLVGPRYHNLRNDGCTREC